MPPDAPVTSAMRPWSPRSTQALLCSTGGKRHDEWGIDITAAETGMRQTSEKGSLTSKIGVQRAALAWIGLAALILLLACHGGKKKTDSAGGEVSLGALTPGGAGLTNIYAATGANALSPVAARARPLVYVPNAKSA